jgi:hypothetical protein
MLRRQQERTLPPTIVEPEDGTVFDLQILARQRTAPRAVGLFFSVAPTLALAPTVLSGGRHERTTAVDVVGWSRYSLANDVAGVAGCNLMQVNVFITRESGELRNKLLVLPINPKVAIPPEFRLGWIYYATVSTGDRMFGEMDAVTLEEHVASRGFASIKPETPDRRKP